MANQALFPKPPTSRTGGPTGRQQEYKTEWWGGLLQLRLTLSLSKFPFAVRGKESPLDSMPSTSLAALRRNTFLKYSTSSTIFLFNSSIIHSFIYSKYFQLIICASYFSRCRIPVHPRHRREKQINV